MKKKQKRLSKLEALCLGFEAKPNDGEGRPAKYSLNEEQINEYNRIKSVSKPVKEVKTAKKVALKTEKPFVLSAWSDKGHMMSIDEYCTFYKLPRNDIKSYKLVSHTGTPFYNILFKDNTIDLESPEVDFDALISKHIDRVEVEKQPFITKNDFDMLTYSDVHIGMDTDSTNNSMYATAWNSKEALISCDDMIKEALKERSSNILVVDELGDFLDGYNGQTTRGGHALPQNMTNEDVFDCGLKFKMKLLDKLITFYDKIIFNNICNDNHAGSFGYFVNSAFKSLAEQKYANVEVNNYRQFINHYFIGDICFVITHGKDDAALKFGFKPQLDPKQIEKIDQYLKYNNIYNQSKLIVFKKGDSHQCLFNMSGSDDFYYYNYPALSPSSQWVQTNFKAGRRGFVLEQYSGTNNTIKTVFI